MEIGGLSGKVYGGAVHVTYEAGGWVRRWPSFDVSVVMCPGFWGSEQGSVWGSPPATGRARCHPNTLRVVVGGGEAFFFLGSAVLHIGVQEEIYGHSFLVRHLHYVNIL